MDDTPEMIRQQMEVTKSLLTEKMESLEHQVAETVQSTGTAVNATVGAVQRTVESITGAVQGTVQSVNNALDLRRQVDRHPLLVLGGAVAVGYLAFGFVSRRAKKALPPPVIVLGPTATKIDGGTCADAEPAIPSSAIVAAYESGQQHAAAQHRTRNLAIDALIGVAHAAAIYAIPHVMNYFAGTPSGGGGSHSEGTGEAQDPSPQDAGHRLRIMPSTGARFGSSI